MIPQRQTGANSRARETHGIMPNPRQVPSGGQRSPSKTSALCKGFVMTKIELPGVGKGLRDGKEMEYTDHTTHMNVLYR